MSKKTFLKTLAMAMLMPAMLLTTACSSEDDLVNNTANTENTINKGYALPVTVNVTRQGDATTRATYNESTSKLAFSAGDKLFVEGSHIDADRFAGTLTWQSGGTFSGTIYTESPYEGTIDDLLNGNYATLLPAGYGSYDYLEIMYEGYEARLGENAYNSFATSKKLAVEQLSFEHGEYNSGTGFVLEPRNAILNFTITGLTASTNVTAALSDDEDWTPDIEGEVTTDGSGNATFAIGLEGSSDLNEFSLSVAGNAITLVSSSKVLAAGKIYNIARNAIPGALIGQFSVSDTKKVYFSKGNLQATYDGSAWTWAFAANQWDYIGNAEGNTKVTDASPYVSDYSGSSTTVDLFGWVGESSNFTGVAQYGITSSTTLNSEDGYGNGIDEILKSDWGATMGSGWCTLSKDEWRYLFNNRSDAADKYGFATVNDVHGIIILPDAFVDPKKNNGSNAFVGSTIDWDANLYTAENWALMEKNGAVFLPAAGYRDWDGGNDAGDRGYYWSSSAYGDENADYANYVYFSSSDFIEDDYTDRYNGHSVRLVRPVQ